MCVKWAVFLFLLSFGLDITSAAPANIQPVFDDLDLSKLKYPSNGKSQRAGRASGALIIPEELPSLLSVAYSNIPPIKKGTDSRVGFGFAFGNHADFQVMLELGPQTNTKALDGTGFQPNTSSNSKRQAPSPPKITKTREKLLQSEASKYLQNWAQRMRLPEKTNYNPQPGEVPNLEDSMVELVKNEKGEFEIQQPQPGNLPPVVLEDLIRLYKVKEDQKTEGKRTEEEVKKITAELSDVDLD